jgi:hypothetical protein
MWNDVEAKIDLLNFSYIPVGPLIAAAGQLTSTFRREVVQGLGKMRARE